MHVQFFILIFFALALASQALAAEPQVTPLKIGATLALSGELAFIGTEERDGLQLAVDEINDRGGISGRPLQLVVEDNTGDAKTAISGVNKLLNVDDVDLLFSAFTHITQAVKDLVSRRDAVMWYASTVGDIAEDNPLFFRDYFDAGQSGATLASYVKNQAQIRELAIIAEANDACEEFLHSFTSQIGNFEITVLLREEVLPGEDDFRSLLLKTHSKKPDAILLCTWRDTDSIIKQLEELHMTATPTLHFLAPFLPASDTPELREIYERNNLVSTWYGATASSNLKIVQQFVLAFKRRFGRDPRPDAAFAYDAVYIIADALMHCSGVKSVDQKCLAGKILEANHSGASGRVTFSASGVSNRNVPLIRVRNGRWVGIGSG